MHQIQRQIDSTQPDQMGPNRPRQQMGPPRPESQNLDALFAALMAQTGTLNEADIRLDSANQDAAAYNSRRFTGILPAMIETIFDSVQKKRKEPERTAALQGVQEAQSGVTSIETKIAAKQAQELQQLYDEMKQTQQPAHSEADVQGMLDQVLLAQNRAHDYRTRPVATGPAGAGGQLFSRVMSRREDDDALATLKQASYAQQGLGQYQAQIAHIREQMKRLETQAREDQIAAQKQRYVMEGKRFDVANRTPVTPRTPTYRDFVNPDGGTSTFMMNSDGSKGREIGPTKAAPVTTGGNKPYASMGAENRIKIGLIKNTADLITKALPNLFEGGKYKNLEASTPKSIASIAGADLREALQSMLRAVSGAAIPEEEIRREVNAMLPAITDTDRQAREKVNRAISKVNNLYASLSSGFEMPDGVRMDALRPFNSNAAPVAPSAPETGGNGPPAAAIEYLKQHPEAQADFIAKYGKLPVNF